MTWWAELLVGIGSGLVLLVLSGLVALAAWIVRKLITLSVLTAKTAGVVDSLEQRQTRVELELWPVPSPGNGQVVERTVHTTTRAATAE